MRSERGSIRIVLCLLGGTGGALGCVPGAAEDEAIEVGEAAPTEGKSDSIHAAFRSFGLLPRNPTVRAFDSSEAITFEATSTVETAVEGQAYISVDDNRLLPTRGQAFRVSLPDYDDGPFEEPRVRTAPEVEAVYPLPTPLDAPPMSAEAEAQVRASHRPPRQPAFERRGGLAWLRACLKVLTA